jgi:hypothetical protein
MLCLDLRGRCSSCRVAWWRWQHEATALYRPLVALRPQNRAAVTIARTARFAAAPRPGVRSAHGSPAELESAMNLWFNTTTYAMGLFVLPFTVYVM